MPRASLGAAIHSLRRVLTAHGGLLLVLVVALASRLIYLNWFRVFPPGDVFNFLSIARGLLSGNYHDDEKRLPFYPLLILITRPFFDWETAAIVVAVVAALAAVLLLYAIGRTLGFSKTTLALSLLLWQVYPPVLTATRPYADTTFIALLAAAILAVLRARTWRGGALAGALLGAAALTRYEGWAAAAAVLAAWFLLGRTTRTVPPVATARFSSPRWRPLAATVALLATLLPYVLLSAANRRPVFGAGYLAEAAKSDTYGAASLLEVWNNAQQIWRRLGLVGFWNVPIAIVRDTRKDPLGTHRQLAARFSEGGEPLTTLVFVGLVALLWRRRWREVVILVTAYGAVTIPPAWNAPFVRYDALISPLPFLLAAGGATAFQRLLERGTTRDRAGRAVRLAAGAALAAVSVGLWTTKFAEDVRNRQLKHNGRDYAYYRALHAARRLPGLVAFEKASAPTEFHFGPRALYLREHVELAGIRREDALAHLRAWGAKYAVVPQARARAFPFLDDPSIAVVQQFHWPLPDGGTTSALIYDLSPAAAVPDEVPS